MKQKRQRQFHQNLEQRAGKGMGSDLRRKDRQKNITTRKQKPGILRVKWKGRKIVGRQWDGVYRLTHLEAGTE